MRGRWERSLTNAWTDCAGVCCECVGTNRLETTLHKCNGSTSWDLVWTPDLYGGAAPCQRACTTAHRAPAHVSPQLS